MLLGQGHISKLENINDNFFGYLVIITTDYSWIMNDDKYIKLVKKGVNPKAARENSIEKKENKITFYRIYNNLNAVKHALITINRNHKISYYCIVDLKMQNNILANRIIYKYLINKEYKHE